jgi:hypothetical protein
LKAEIGENADEVGSRIREYLNVCMETQLNWDSNRAAFAAWRAAGKVFTLLHEFAHLLLYVSGHQTSAGERHRPPIEQQARKAAALYRLVGCHLRT